MSESEEQNVKVKVQEEKETDEIVKRTQFEMIMKRLLQDKASVVCLAIIFLLIIIAIFAPWIAPYSYEEISLLEKLQGPSLQHLCGTDKLGRDIFSRLVYGSRNSLIIGFLSTGIAFVIGVPIGIICAYAGNKTDTIIMRVVDIIQAIPGMLLAIAISASLGIGIKNCIISLSIGRIAGFLRMARAASLNVVDMEYIQAAKAMNIPRRKILLKHILPNAISPLIVQATMGVAGSVMASAGLSFIGLGVQAPEAEWGCMLTAGRDYLRSSPHVFIAPLVAIMLLVLSLNLLGDGLRDALDPKMKN